ncbi:MULTISPECIES: hypothetical protein [Streptomycetaceae]|uniref:CchlP n=1 Tax=Streptantibioticus cattleyicolor (strain ATCC 35852 / DSM 46488 / JCM 4925 / NBRC 14057 / NRRL 8057) TaxID=1003195 RepID=F8JX76_STREN|nr:MULTISPECIES: hypothetical protein [Streptomycetaceae]AEW94541.1 hypothetical protein SCATT_21700 [Streptantibioticus cattleyicolor NRRL 8057 = DSM 46488]MYS59181.1 hypothetical protein [Streptomyces sp. SID5468]CCB74900.1 conserved protein of unknown function [Streptantibioticus cattleyicolor NRRL 8057 = DSM 46488]
MDAELATLAASTLVGLMVTDAWGQAKKRVAGFFARGGDTTAAEEELDTSRAELMAAEEDADEATAADIQAEWRLRLRRALQADPAAADELRRLLAELEPYGASPPSATVHNVVNGGVFEGPVIQGQNFTGLTFHGTTPPDSGRRDAR